MRDPCAEYWNEVERINRIGVTDPGWQCKPVEYDVSTGEGIIKSNTAYDCSEMMGIFSLHYEEIKENNSSLRVAIAWDMLREILVNAGYVTCYEPVVVDDSDFGDDLPF